MHEWDDFVCEMDVTADWAVSQRGVQMSEGHTSCRRRVLKERNAVSQRGLQRSEGLHRFPSHL